MIKNDKNHLIIEGNKITIKCHLHPNNKNILYCLDCNFHLCKECSNHRKHMRHKKQIIEDIQPSQEEINFFLKIINEYKNKINNSGVEKENKLVELKNNLNKNKQKETKDFNLAILNKKNEFEKELIENENKYNYEINELKKKYEKELLQKKSIFENKDKSIKDKYNQINQNIKFNYEKKLNILELSYKDEV